MNLAYGMATYQQSFRDNAFGNYEDILTKMTLREHPLSVNDAAAKRSLRE